MYRWGRTSAIPHLPAQMGEQRELREARKRGPLRTLDALQLRARAAPHDRSQADAPTSESRAAIRSRCACILSWRREPIVVGDERSPARAQLLEGVLGSQPSLSVRSSPSAAPCRYGATDARIVTTTSLLARPTMCSI